MLITISQKIGGHSPHSIISIFGNILFNWFAFFFVLLLTQILPGDLPTKNCKGVISGFGLNSYELAIRAIIL